MINPRLLFPLVYTSEEKRAEYRGLAQAVMPPASLTYDQLSVAAHRGGGFGEVQQRLKGRTVFVPDLDIRKNFWIRAVIDRMIILLEVKARTSWSGIKAVIDVETGTLSMVANLGHGVSRISWCESINLPPSLAGAATGTVFAVLIQDPKPEMLMALLRAIESRYGIKGEVQPWLMELSLDFYAIGDPHRSIILREQMVGLLQRHHHCSGVKFHDYKSDARQVYGVVDDQGKNTVKTSYLFASPNAAPRRFSDSNMTEHHVRQRLKHFQTGHQLFLDATVYKGSPVENLQFSIQHKIADQRNAAAGTMKVLPYRERRARLEVMIQGTGNLATLGLTSITDLKGYRFRDIHKKYLTLWLPTAGKDQPEDMLMRHALRDRGLYGSEHLLQLQALETKEANALESRTPGRKARDRTGKGLNTRLVAWNAFNDAAGEAIDALTGAWRQFTFPAP